MSFGIMALGSRFGARASRPSAGVRQGSDAPTEKRPEVATRRYQMLDVWRGVVCLLVVMEHVGVVLCSGHLGGTGLDGWARRMLYGVLGLNFGSPLFFVMSGYCIAASLNSSRRKGQSPPAFLARRLWRIYPTYWAALLCFVVVSLAVDAPRLTWIRESVFALQIDSPRVLTAAQWLGNLTLTETWRPLVGGGPSSVFTRVAWSLCYQEQFYLICFLALWLAPKRLHGTLALATVGIVLYRLFAWDSGRMASIEGTFALHWHVFAVGLGVWWRLNAGATAPKWARQAVDAGLAAVAVIGLCYGHVPTAAGGLFGLLLVGLFRWDAVAGEIAWLAPLRACGRRSYSVYLAHLPVVWIGNITLVNLGLTGFWTRALLLAPVVTASGVAAGWLLHHAVERHFMGAPPLPRLSLVPARRTLVPVLVRIDSNAH